MKKMLGLLAIALTLAAGTAWAGEEFCDDRGGGPRPPDDTESGSGPGTGSCEVNLVYDLSTANARPLESRGRIRETGFSEALLSSLRNSLNEVEIAWHLDKLKLGPDLTRASEARVIEWSFRPINQSGAERMLVISVRRKEGELALMADWMQAPAPDWSYATASPAEPVWLDHRSVVLDADPIGQPLYLKWTPTAVVVSVWAAERWQELRFPLPSTSWKPVRLRNAVLLGVPTQNGTQVSIGWPLAFRSYWSKPLPAVGMGLPEQPVAPTDPTTPESQY